MFYTFVHDTIADGPDGRGRKFASGDVIDETEIATGCLESCLRVGTLKPAPEQADADDAGDDTPPVAGTEEKAHAPETSDTETKVETEIKPPRKRGKK